MTAGTYTGTRIADYRLERLMGRGSFGEVYRARDVRSGRTVAIKLLLNDDISREEYQNFWKEAQTLANLDGHPHIVRVFAFNLEEELPFMVMEFAPGGSLLDRHPFPLARVVAYTSQVAAALQFAHDANIVHHDVKPANLLLGAHGQILLSDFGVAEANHSTRRARSEVHQDGTPAYMPPEKIIQGFSRRAGDQYSLAVMVYQWLSGRLPFRTIDEALHGQASSLRSFVTVPSAVAAVVAQGMARNPDERYPRVEDFASALERAAVGKQRRPARDALLVLVCSALLTVVSLILGNLGQTALLVGGAPDMTTTGGPAGIALVLLFFGVLPLAPQLLGKFLGVWRGGAAALLYLLVLNMAGRVAWPALITTALMWHNLFLLSPLVPTAMATGFLYTSARAHEGKLGCGYAGLVSFAAAAGFWYLVILFENGLALAGTDLVVALAFALPIGLLGGLLDMVLFHALLVKKNGRVLYPAKVTAVAAICLLFLCLIGAGYLLFPRFSFSSSGSVALDLQVQATGHVLLADQDSAGRVSIAYIGDDGHLHELSGQPAGSWNNNDLTALSGGVPALPGSALAGYRGNDTRQHIVYFGRDRQLYELSTRPGPGWESKNLSALSQGGVPLPGSALTAYQGGDHSEHINYINADHQLHELYLSPAGAWSDNDLSALSQAVVPLSGSALSGSVGGDGSVHVNFIGTDRHVHELYWFNGWSDNDLTRLSRAVAPLSESALSGYTGADGSV
ncbi:MAG TPA: protein kinase, partial [Ktedonobacteraceae bacterium]